MRLASVTPAQIKRIMQDNAAEIYQNRGVGARGRPLSKSAESSGPTRCSISSAAAFTARTVNSRRPGSWDAWRDATVDEIIAIAGCEPGE